jgi:subtilisin family serine protease
MSIGAVRNSILDGAVKALHDEGIVVVVAAGNNNTNACSASPAGAVQAITVGATTVSVKDDNTDDARSDFSNWGPCVDILAPGTSVISSWPDGKYRSISGTSMASPHVAGVAAAYLGLHPTASPDDVRKYLLSVTTNGVIDLECRGDTECEKTPNKLLFYSCDL